MEMDDLIGEWRSMGDTSQVMDGTMKEMSR